MFELPTVLRAQEVLDKAFKRASKMIAKGGDRPTRTRNLAIGRVRSAGDTIESSLRSYVKGFPSLDRLPPFYRELVDILVDQNRLKHHLGAVDWAAGTVAEISRESVRRMGRANLKDMSSLRAAAFGRFSSVLARVEKDLDALVEARMALRRLPVIDPDVTTLVVAGYPNVGKSAFVRAVSSGRPRVAEYPFTTKGVSVGHFDRGHRRYQILDTPGLLDRPMEKRNRIERQAISALAHLADVVVFMLDPTETCGYSVVDQQRLLETVRSTFPDVPMFVVENKSDLGGPTLGHPRLSVTTQEGLSELFDRIMEEVAHRRPAKPAQER